MKLTCILPFFLVLCIWSPSVHDSDPCRWGETHTVPRPLPNWGHTFPWSGHHGYGRCESWTTKKAKHQRTDAFELWCWRRLLRVRWIARRSNQSILKEISCKYSLDGQMLKLKLQYFDHLMGKADSLEKTLILGKIKGKRRRGQQRMRCWMASLTQ